MTAALPILYGQSCPIMGTIQCNVNRKGGQKEEAEYCISRLGEPELPDANNRSAEDPFDNPDTP